MKYLFLLLLLTARVSGADVTVWPVTMNIGQEKGGEMQIFQPLVDSFKDGKVEATSAFKLTQDGKTFYGSCVIAAQALVDKDSGQVALSSFKVSSIQAPTATIDKKELQTGLEKELNKKKVLISYQGLVANLAASKSDGPSVTAELKNIPPRFVFTTSPAILIMISGEPKWVPSAGAKEVERVLNSSALFLHQKDKTDYYLWALGGWFSAKTLNGPYTKSKSGPSSKFVMVKDELVKDKKVDEMNGKRPDGKPMFPAGTVPQIIVANEPTELLQSVGEPKYTAIENTSLLYLANSPNSIFMESKTQNFIVLVSGRWFEAPSLKGPWSYVSAKKLPKDFAKIPVTSPVAEVLVSVPNTEQAKEARIVSQIPQTAIVKRSLKPDNFKCDGTIKWEKISGSSLQYAGNCNSPLIETSKTSYYLVQNGVWFYADNASGPWMVAAAVPSEIYNIPVTSPLYYVTFVKIYGVTPDTVSFGYTPGYHGTFVSADGTIVYGTGYDYTSYISSTEWYPAPTTYGFGVGYGWGYEAGFFMGMSMGSLMYPWGWGACCYGPVFVNINVTNTYTKWGTHTVISGAGGHGVTTNTIGQTKFIRGNNSENIYATRDGSLYRKTDSGWQRHIGPGSWTDVNKKGVDNIERLNAADRPGRRAEMPAHHEMENRGNSMPHLNGGGFRAGGFGGGGFRR